MKKIFDLYKTTNFFALLFIIAVWSIGTFYYSSGLCSQQNCSFEFRTGFLNPVLSLSIYLLPTLALLVLFPSHYFRRWLWYIASWALPLSLYLIFSQSIYTTALFSSRTFFAQALMQTLFVVTVFFIAGVWLVMRYIPTMRDAR